MARPLDVGALLRRGGIMTADEVKQLAQDLTQAKLVEMSIGSSERSLDQPVKVIPFSPSAAISSNRNSFGVRCRRKCKQYLEFFGKLRGGACVLEFARPLGPRDFETRAYSYLPDGKEYKPNPKEKCTCPGRVPLTPTSSDLARLNKQ